jgi:hypothetical protein
MPRIEAGFLDMDGVIVNWHKRVAELFGMDEQKFIADWPRGVYGAHRALGVTEDVMWARIDALGEAFWSGCEPYSWRDKLFELCANVAPVYILSMPWNAPSAHGKFLWLERWKGRPFHEYILTPKKHLLASKTAVLVDDHEDQVDAFRKAGGLAILFPRPWNSHHQYAENPVSFVRDSLAEMTT